MKAISLKQPWANLIASGEKTIETRTWKTNYKGDLLICASKSGNIEPRGCAVCIVEVYDCRPMTREDETAACCEVYPGAWSWFLRNVRKIKPFPVRGQLGLFEVKEKNEISHMTLIEKTRRDLRQAEVKIARLKKRLEGIRACLREMQAEFAGRIKDG